MQSTAKTPQAYVDSLPEERKVAIEKMRQAIKKTLPKGFEEVMCYGMLGYVVPHTLYPKGYPWVLSVWRRKKTSWLYTIWVFTPIQNC